MLDVHAMNLHKPFLFKMCCCPLPQHTNLIIYRRASLLNVTQHLQILIVSIHKEDSNKGDEQDCKTDKICNQRDLAGSVLLFNSQGYQYMSSDSNFDPAPGEAASLTDNTHKKRLLDTLKQQFSTLRVSILFNNTSCH